MTPSHERSKVRVSALGQSYILQATQLLTLVHFDTYTRLAIYTYQDFWRKCCVRIYDYNTIVFVGFICALSAWNVVGRL